MTNKNDIRWGMIGCGNVTEIKSGPAFSKLPNSQLIAVMRRDLEKAQSYAQRHNIPFCSNNAQDIIKNNELDAVYIATPPESHKYYTIAALEEGKDVYVEKPMALNANECREMIDVAKRCGRSLFVAYYRRYLPGFLKVKEWVESGAIGKVLFARILMLQPSSIAKNKEIPWRLDPKIAGGGLFVDLASHQIDFMNFLFGTPIKVNGTASNKAGRYKAEDTVNASIHYPQNITVTGNWSFCAHEHQDVMEIIGEKGRITFSGFGHEPISLHRLEGTIHFPYTNPQHIQSNLIHAVNEELLGGESCVSTGQSALLATEVMDAILKDFYHH